MNDATDIQQVQPIRVMISSSVHGFQDALQQIESILTGFGYEVWSSHKGSLPLDSDLSAFGNCLHAVEGCDVFLGIIRGSYGSGKDGDEPSITHQEFKAAIQLDKFRFLAAHHDVVIARQLLRQFRNDRFGKPRPPSYFKSKTIIDDIRILDLYDEATRSDIPLSQRTGNWVQEYRDTEDLLSFITTQLQNPERIRESLERRSNSTGNDIVDQL